MQTKVKDMMKSGSVVITQNSLLNKAAKSMEPVNDNVRSVATKNGPEGVVTMPASICLLDEEFDVFDVILHCDRHLSMGQDTLLCDDNELK